MSKSKGTLSDLIVRYPLGQKGGTKSTLPTETSLTFSSKDPSGVTPSSMAIGC